MARVFWAGGVADEVADFDEYDPTPYGGGYDLALTFGRALPPSDETCYPISTTSSSSSGDRPQYGRRPESAGESYSAAENHRRRPPAEDSHGPAGYGGGYGGRPHADQEEESHGSSAGHGYGRKAHDEDAGAEAYGAAGGYRKPKPAYGDERPKYHGDGKERLSYGRKKHDDEDDSTDERKLRYKKQVVDDDDDDERKPGYKKYGDDDDERKPRYKKHDDDDDSDDDKKQRYGKNNRRRQDYDD